MDALPLLDALFRTNPTGYRRVAGADEFGTLRREAELLLEGVDSSKVSGLNKLAVDGAASADKFLNTLAELRFAHLFQLLGARVSVLLDGEFEPARYTPDLLVHLPNGLQILVDVVRGSSGSPPMAKALRARLLELGLAYRVESCLGQRLSVPASNVQGHRSAEDLCKAVADSIALALERARGRGVASGIARALETPCGIHCHVVDGADARAALYDDVTASPSEHWLGTFGFDPSVFGVGAAGGGVTAAHFIDDVTLGSKFLEKVRFKSQKRLKLPRHHDTTPFVVAIQSDETELRPVTVLSTLTGPRCWLQHPRQPTAVPKLEAACGRGWRALLKEWQYIESPRVAFPHYGAFGDEADPWAREVSGVVVLHDSHTTVQWLPNPFATEAIADQRLLDLGLPLDMLGSPHPSFG